MTFFSRPESLQLVSMLSPPHHIVQTPFRISELTLPASRLLSSPSQLFTLPGLFFGSGFDKSIPWFAHPDVPLRETLEGYLHVQGVLPFDAAVESPF